MTMPNGNSNATTNHQVKFGRPIWILFLGILGLGLLIVLLDLSSKKRLEVNTDVSIQAGLESCIVKSEKEFVSQVSVIDAKNFALYHCHQVTYYSLQLEDFRIRKLKFVDQSGADTIILWMVVLITLSGVVLATYQVHASFSLAGRERSSNLDGGGEFGLTADNGFVVKSSVTGLLILVVSLAFFLVYVTWVYQIEEFNTKSVDNEPEPPVVSSTEDTESLTRQTSQLLENVGNLLPKSGSVGQREELLDQPGGLGDPPAQ